MSCIITCLLIKHLSNGFQNFNQKANEETKTTNGHLNGDLHPSSIIADYANRSWNDIVEEAERENT